MSIVLPPLATPLPLELKQLIDRRIEAESALAARETDADHVGGAGEALVDRAGDLLESLVRDSTEWLAKSGESPRKILARGRFVLAWSIGRLSEYDGKGEESLRLSLEHYEKTGELLHLPPPPALDSVPSVSRPRTSKDATVKLPMQDAFVGEILAEWSRIQATFAFAVLLGPAGKEDVLSDLIDLAARRNVQALFTPLNESTVNSDDGENEEAGTVIGNARLLEDMASMRDWSSEPQLWKRRIDWATHICDVNFVAASMSANRLVESASTSTKILSSSKTGDAERREIRAVLEATIRRLVPFEVAQGKCLLKLGKTMLDCVRETHLGGTIARTRVEEEDEEEESGVVVPEVELVTETRAILARSVQHLENAYTSFCRSPRTKSTNRAEQRMLRRIEAVYCLLEVLDNDVPEVVALRTTRIARAITINDRLAVLGTSEGLEEDSEDDDDADDSEEELEEEADGTPTGPGRRSRGGETVEDVTGKLAHQLEKQPSVASVPLLPLSGTPTHSRNPSLSKISKVDDEDSDSIRVAPTAPIPAWTIVLLWIGLSTTVILFNREIMIGNGKTVAFPYPISLTTLHLAFQTIATRLLHRYTNLISGPLDYEPLAQDEASEKTSEMVTREAKAASVAMSWTKWRTSILPPAAFFSVSLILSNAAYLYISVAYIHMLKAASPVAILLAAFAFRTRAFSMRLLAIVLVISGGVGLSSYGEANFNLTGVLLQLTAIVVEATRITLIQILLQGEKGMSPLKTLYFFAPICLFINASLVLPVDGMVAIQALPRIGFFTILLNCTLTFLLNLSAVYLISLSSMVLSLSKVIKDIFLVLGSALLLGDQISTIQAVGYAIATAGLVWYKDTPS